MKDPFARSSHRVDPADNIVQQARQGSIAAIVQVLNDNLTDVGVRTRAVFADGWLQLLCESPQADRLDRDTVVDRIRSLLEQISPRNIRRLNLYCRIAREDQLLWLDEIRRDPETQLLWSEKVVLRRPNPIKRAIAALKTPSSPRPVALPKKIAVSKPRNRDRFQQGLIGGAILAVLLVIGGGWAYQTWLADSSGSESLTETDSEPNLDNAEPSAEDPAAPTAATPTPTATPTPDPFAQAVALAEQASIAGQTAQTRAQWLDLAAKWQRAADFMAQVPPDDPRYETARDRTQVYRQNSDVAQQRAEMVAP